MAASLGDFCFVTAVAAAAPAAEEETAAAPFAWEAGAVYKYVAKRLLKYTALVKPVNILTRDVDNILDSVSEQQSRRKCTLIPGQICYCSQMF